jgi:hypothetical protein
MQELMDTYNNNVDDIEKFLKETIINSGNLSIQEATEYEKLFKIFPSLELIYTCNKDTYIQISPNIYKSKSSNIQIGHSRKYLLTKVNMSHDEIAITRPYISSATGKTCVTVLKEEDGIIYLLDFELSKLLQRLGLINIQKEFNIVSKVFYFITANIMMLLALFTVGYALFSFFNSIFIESNLSIESIFKPVIALTLGLAIFDLAKTVLEQEVVFKSYSKNGKAEYKVLIKFSITIIIALLIESLMVVFKIAIDNYAQMIHAFYLLSGVSILTLVLGLFIYFTTKIAKA